MNVPAQRRRIAAAPAQARAPFPMHVVPAILVVYACLLPRELTFQVLGVDFAPFRTVLMLLLPVIAYQAVRQPLRPSFVDLLVIFAMIWFFLSLTVVESINSALVTGLSEGLNLALAYFTGRVSIRTSADFRRFVYAMIPGLLLCSAVLAAESIGHQTILRPFFARVTGQVPVRYIVEVRQGLMRATGPFVHPILGGVFMASFLPLVWYMVQRPVPWILGMLGVGGFFFSLSSTGFLGIIVGGGLIFTNFVQRITRLPVFPAVVGATLFGFVIIELFSGAGVFSFIIRRLTFSSGTGYYRMAIWDYAGADALNHPIFGIGLREYIRPSWMITPSVDAHWLLLVLRHGFPLGMAVLFAMITSAAMSLRGAWSPYPLDQRAAYAMGFSLISIIFTGLSVALWEGVGIWMTVLTGMGVSFGQQMARASKAQASGRAPLAPRLKPRPA